jgi:glycerol-1-phosphatase
MLVLTGVSSANDAVYTDPEQRPTHISRHPRGLHEPAEQIAVAPQSAWRVDIASAANTATATGADADGRSADRPCGRPRVVAQRVS